MLRIGKLTDYATVVLAVMAAEPARWRAAAHLATATNLPAATVSKVLKELQRAGLIASSRGACGGYRLARSPDRISAAQILDVFEGPVALTECSRVGGRCGIERSCRVGHVWQKVNAAVRRALEDLTLRQLAGLDVPGVRVSDLASDMRLGGAR